jgi:ketosteroid isomerase-like protein
MRSSGPIEDRLAIQDLYALYADTSSRGDREAWLSCWADDAQWCSHIFDCRGKQAIAAQYDQIMAPFEGLVFLSQVGPIEVSGDTARGRSAAREIGRLKDGGLFKLAGTYDDVIERRDGVWLFARRDYRPVVQEF